MKQGNVLNLPKGWEVKKLGEVASFSQGIQVGLEHHLTEHKDGYVRFIRIVDYTQNTDDIRFVPNPGEKYFVNEEDIVMVRYGTPGLIGRGKAGVIANNLFRIKIERKDLTNDYLTLFLSQDVIQNYLSTQGSATMPALNFGQLKTVEVCFPPLKEQQRIVAILDEAFTAIDKAKANTEQNLKNAKDIFESYLSTVDATKVSLGSLVDIKTGKLNSNAAVENGQYPFFTCSREIFAIDNYAFDLEAILLAGNNASGDFNVKHYKGKFNAYQRTYVITVNKEQRILYRYLYFQLLKSLKEFKSMSVGANTRFLKLGMIQGLQIALPSLKEQQKIVSKLDALREQTKKLEAVYVKKLQDLEELKKSVSSKAFSGEL
jgi:type I restriction enzyme S subunit